MQLAANLTWLYAHLPLAQRFDAAAQDGFSAVEILLPYDEPAAWYAHALRASGLQLALFNTPVSEGAGRLGLAAVPGAQQQFRSDFAQALDLAQATGGRCLHVMAGHVAEHAWADCGDTLLDNLDHALPLAQAQGVQLSLEALNRSDMPGYFYHLPEQALAIVRHFNSPWLRLQFDFYHCVKEGLDVRAEVKLAAGWVGHAQIAGAPDRYEPDLTQDHLLQGLRQLHQSGYDGWLGCEYRPRSLPAAGLPWCDVPRLEGWLA